MRKRLKDSDRSVGLTGSQLISAPLLAVAFALALPAVALGDSLGVACDVVVNVAGQNEGSIPDAASGSGCGTPGAPRDVVFNANFLPGYALETLDVTANIVHTWFGDLTATLISPAGVQHTLFGRVGAVTATSCGDSSNMGDVYVFSDAGTLDLWAAATAASSSEIIPSGAYRTTNSGGAGATNPAPPTSITDKFGGLSSAAAAGTWTLRVSDSGPADLGSVGSTMLSLCFRQVGPQIFDDGFEL